MLSAKKVAKVGLLLVSLPCDSQIRRIPADVGLAAFVLEVDLRLIERRAETGHRPACFTPVPVGGQMLSQSSRRALPQVIQFCASSGRNSAKRFLLPAIEHVALKLRDDERQARDLGRKVAQLDAAKIGQRNFGAAVRLRRAAC